VAGEHRSGACGLRSLAGYVGQAVGLALATCPLVGNNAPVSNTPSPFLKPDPDLDVRVGAPPLRRPTKEEAALFAGEATALVRETQSAQEALRGSGSYELEWLDGRHVLLAGATGPGIGGALAAAILANPTVASLTIVSRDLKRSVGFETGKLMESAAAGGPLDGKFHWRNDGLGLEGPSLQSLIETLKGVDADQIVYFNTVAAANSGLMPGMPPVFVKDRDDSGLFQWQLEPLSERELEMTRFVMGEMAVRFPATLEGNGFSVAISVFADWRGSLDRISRDPGNREYGRQSAYSTSLFLPKDVIQDAVRASYGTDTRMLDVFYPMMRSRALAFIPGATLTADVMEALERRVGISPRGIPQLALMALDEVGNALRDKHANPFPRLDDHDAHLDEWLFEVMARLTNDESSDFHYRRWV
jgi:hypothetical protein